MDNKKLEDCKKDNPISKELENKPSDNLTEDYIEEKELSSVSPKDNMSGDDISIEEYNKEKQYFENIEIPFIPYSKDVIPKGIDIDKIIEEAKREDIENPLEQQETSSFEGPNLSYEETEEGSCISSSETEKNSDLGEKDILIDENLLDSQNEKLSTTGVGEEEMEFQNSVSEDKNSELPIDMIDDEMTDCEEEAQSITKLDKLKKLFKMKKKIFILSTVVVVFLGGAFLVLQKNQENKTKPEHNNRPTIEKPNLLPTEETVDDSLIAEVDPHQQLKDEIEMALEQTKEDKLISVNGVEVNDRELSISVTANQSLGSDIFKLNNFILQRQFLLLTLMNEKISDLNLKVTIGNDTYEFLTPKKTIEFIDSLHYQDRHSFQLWWTETQVLKNNISYKDSIKTVNLYVEDIGPNWTIEEVPELEMPVVPETENPDGGGTGEEGEEGKEEQLSAPSNLELVWSKPIRDERFDTLIYIPDTLSYEKWIDDNNTFIVEAKGDSPYDMRITYLTSMKKYSNVNKDDLFKALTDDFKKVTGFEELSTGTFDSYDKAQTIKYKTYHDKDTDTYMYYIIGFKSEYKYEMLLKMNFDLFSSTKTMLELNIPRIEFLDIRSKEELAEEEQARENLTMLDLSGFTHPDKEIKNYFSTNAGEETQKDYENVSLFPRSGKSENSSNKDDKSSDDKKDKEKDKSSTDKKDKEDNKK